MARSMLVCSMAALMSACGGSSASGGGDQYVGPIASNDTARGQEVFTNVCMACHSGGPSLENIGWEAARVRHQVREGSGGMSPLSTTRVSDDDLEAVLAYMVTIGGVVGEAGAADTGGGDTGEDTSGDDAIDDESAEDLDDTDA